MQRRQVKLQFVTTSALKAEKNIKHKIGYKSSTDQTIDAYEKETNTPLTYDLTVIQWGILIARSSYGRVEEGAASCSQ